jgi:hypothetical protein
MSVMAIYHQLSWLHAQPKQESFGSARSAVSVLGKGLER